MASKNEPDIRKIQKVKRSYYVTLPILYVRELGWDKKREVVIQKRGKELRIKGLPYGNSGK